MKRLVIALTIIGALGFVACGKSGGKAADTPPISTPPPGVAPTGPNVNPVQCQVGQVYAAAYGCLNRYSCLSGYGWVPSEARCVPGTPVSESTVYGAAHSGRFYGMLSIVNQAQFELMLKYAGLCDPMTVGWNWGTWDCTYWARRGGFVELRTFGATNGTSSANLLIGAGTTWAGQLATWSYNNQMTSNSQYISFSQQARVVDYNSSQGIQVLGISGGQEVGIRLIAANGHLTDQNFQAELWFQNVKVATVGMARY